MLPEKLPLDLQQGPSVGQYFPALDGLRGLMALGVVVAHVNLPWFPGALIMMDVFFAISGFIITLILHRNIQRTGSLQLAQFWKRRVLRLYPALLVVVGTCLVLAALLVDDLSPVFRDAVETLLYVSNWSKLYNYGYPSIFGHTWSLSIEEQFYLLWPLLLLVLLRQGANWRGMLALALMALSVGAWRVFLVVDEAPWSRLYYALETRMDAFIVGGLLAFGWHTWNLKWARHSGLHFAMYGGAIALLCTVILGRPREIHYFIWQQSLVLLLSAATILLLSSPRVSVLQQLLGSKPCVALGVRCYSIYLWHWPLIWLLMGSTRLDKVTLLLIVVPLTLLLSALTYRYVEAPMLAKRTAYLGSSA